MVKRTKVPIPIGWTKERLHELDPQRPPRTTGGFAPYDDTEAANRLIEFFEDSNKGVTWRSDFSDLVACIRRAIIRQHHRVGSSAAWTEYRDRVEGTYWRAERLSAAIAGFAMRQGGSPTWLDMNDWFRLSDLLKRVGEKIDTCPTGRALPEIDQDFIAALDLIRRRLNPTIARLQIAAAATASETGRPRRSPGESLARELRVIWERETGKKATITRQDGQPAGPFVEYCELALNLLPIDDRGKIGMTKNTIAEATRKELGKGRRKPSSLSK